MKASYIIQLISLVNNDKDLDIEIMYKGKKLDIQYVAISNPNKDKPSITLLLKKEDKNVKVSI